MKSEEPNKIRVSKFEVFLCTSSLFFAPSTLIMAGVVQATVRSNIVYAIAGVALAVVAMLFIAIFIICRVYR